MNHYSKLDKFHKELSNAITVSELYDYEKVKDNICAVLLPRNHIHNLSDDVPHLLLQNDNLILLPFIFIPDNSDWLLGYYVTSKHLQLWNKNLKDIVDLLTMSP